jgi:hypothetical protein
LFEKFRYEVASPRNLRGAWPSPFRATCSLMP